MTQPTIVSSSNPRVKDVVRLRRQRHRHDPSRFVIDGRRLVERARAAGVDLIEVFAVAGTGIAGATEVSESVMDKLSGGGQEVVAVARAWDLNAPPIQDRERWIGLVEVEKPGNVGAVLRTAAALGFTGLLLVDSGVDVFRPNVVRNSMGALFGLPVVSINRDDFPSFCSDRSARVVAAVSRDGDPLWEAPLVAPLVLLVGSEAEGLPESVIDQADVRVTIPMQDSVLDSLNASVAASILMAESNRQGAGQV